VQQTNSTERRQIASLISRLLSHYWTAADRPETREAQIEDWIIDLHQFGAEAVARACGRWRITEHRRPTPADIVKLAIEEQDVIAISEAKEGPAKGKKPYAAMTEAEKLDWHTDVYAFRRVYLDIYDTTSPPDPKGARYNPNLVEAAEHRLREQKGKVIGQDREAWARSRGWASWLERQDAIAASKETMADGDWNHPERSTERVPGFKSLAEALGVTATEEPPS